MGAAGQSPGLDHPGKQAHGPGLERPGLSKEKEPKADNNSGRKNKTPEEQKSIRGELAGTRSSRASVDTIKDSTTPSVRRWMKAKTREERKDKGAWTGSAGQSRKEKPQRIKDQLEERAKAPAPDWNIPGGAAQNAGLVHPGEWAQCPGLEHLGQRQETRRRPPGQEQPEGRGAKNRHGP